MRCWAFLGRENNDYERNNRHILSIHREVRIVLEANCIESRPLRWVCRTLSDNGKFAGTLIEARQASGSQCIVLDEHTLEVVKMSNKRGTVYVDRLVQGALARRIVVHWCVFFALSMISLTALELFLGDPELSLTDHLSVLWGKYAFFVILMVSILPTFVYDSMKLSNRFAGPVMRLRESIHDLAQGESVEELKFRDNDFWRELSDDFNAVAKRVHGSEAKA